MNFISDNLVYRRGQDYLRRRRERQDSALQNITVDPLGKNNDTARPSRSQVPYQKLDGSGQRLEQQPASVSTSSPRPRRMNSLPLPAEMGDSADDEGDSSVIEYNELEDTATGSGDSGWKHTDRVLNARLGRQEQLQREKGVVDDALRTSLSTFLMLQSSISTPAPVSQHPGMPGDGLGLSRSPPSLSTSPSSTLTLRGASRPRDSKSPPPIAYAGRASLHSSVQASVHPSRPVGLMERRRTYTAKTPTASLQLRNQKGSTTPVDTSRPSASDPEWTDAGANVSSSSSFEDLAMRHSPQEGSDLDMDFSSSSQSSDRAPSPTGGVAIVKRSRTRTDVVGGTSPSPKRQRRRPRRSRVHSLRRSAVSGNRDGTQSDPERRTSVSRRADDSFIELLEAAKTFMAMNPRYGSASSTGVSIPTRSSLASAAPVIGDGTPRGRSISLPQAPEEIHVPKAESHSPAPPASMSASTNFDLSSNDSPPSHGLTNSRFGDEDASKDSHDEVYRPSMPQPIVSDPRLSSESKREAELSPGKEEEGSSTPYRPVPETWLDWFRRQFGRFTVGISLVGIGLVLAVGIGIFKPPMIRRNPSRYGFPIRITFP